MLRQVHKHDGHAKVHLGGWKKQHTDARDEEYRLKLHPAFLQLPTSCDNRNICSPIQDQGDLGSCTAHMFAGLVESNEIKRHAPSASSSALPSVTVSNVVLDGSGNLSYSTQVSAAKPAPAKLVRASRLFEYYATRKIEGTINEDSGATIRDSIKTGNKYGVADESLYPYNIAQFTKLPPQNVWQTAATHKVTSYHAISDGDLNTMKSVLASGFLIGFGFQVYDYMLSEECATSGILPVPGPDESLQGGHAVCLVGYDDAKEMFLVRNSWGTNWGQSGYFWMSYDYVGNTDLASDFWCVQSAPI